MNTNGFQIAGQKMTQNTTRQDGSYERATAALRGYPGAVVVYTEGKPVFRPYPLCGAALRIGRNIDDMQIDDCLLSREHAEFIYTGTEWIVRDLGSSNGTYVNSGRLSPDTASRRAHATLRGVGGARVVRVGRTLVVLMHDVSPLLDGTVQLSEDLVCGPRLQSVMAEVEDTGRAANMLHINGASGSGKELAARRFHVSSPRSAGPFVPVNCAAIPTGVAERLLFGAVKGAYSGAEANAVGYVQAANGGTLFLDEIAELDLSVQAKLLRVLEAREVIPLGATTGTSIDIQLCSATHRDLRAAVAAGEFRSDLYFRVARPEVKLPALRERREEIPHLIAFELQRLSPELEAHALFVESCLIRDWPGNVRELRREVAQAGGRALAAGEHSVTASMLSSTAGVAFASSAVDPRSDEVGQERPGKRQMTPVPSREELLVILEHDGWNLAAAARTLGAHRTQICRWIERYSLERPIRRTK